MWKTWPDAWLSVASFEMLGGRICCRSGNNTCIAAHFKPWLHRVQKKRRLRRRVYSVPGPNAVWHIDGYDKLSRYGITIHGCVDGFSRQIIWLNAGVSHKNPNIIATYYIESIWKQHVPTKVTRRLRNRERPCWDYTKNSPRRNHRDEYAGNRSFLYGKSTQNQRIECLWGMVRRQGMQYWINFFQELAESGFHDGGYLDQELSRFCFLEMVQVWQADKNCFLKK